MFKKNQLKIGIDARFYGPKQKGLGRYVQKLVNNLEKADSDNQYFIFLRKDNWDEYIPQNHNFKKVLADYRWYTLKEQIMLPFKIRKYNLDLIHFPHFNVPIFCSIPYIITIHDLILKKFPTQRASTLNPISYFIKNIFYHLVISIGIKRARRIIAVSEYTKNDILKYFKVPSDKISVIYEGVPDDKNIQSKAFKINSPYFLYVGNAYPHKNLERLILAFEKLIEEKKDLKLVLVGGMDYFYQRLKDQFSHYNWIIFTDFVLDNQLIYLYQNALGYVFPSLYEGFGLPPLEAMNYNLPVICSNSSCLPEILGDAAIYFNPEDINDIFEKMKLILEDDNLKEELIKKGREKIKQYSWEKMAVETLSFYLKA